MDLLDRILEQDFSLNARILDSFDPLAREMAKVLEPIRRRIHNAKPTISRFCYSETACLKHQNFFVSKILKALRKSGLQGYSLHTGQAFSIRYTSPNLSVEEETSEEVFEIRNKDQGFLLQFRIVEGNALGPAIHTLFLIRNTAQQGSFYSIKRMLVDELWRKVLQPAGFALLYGRAVWSPNSEIRHTCPKSKDWREVLCYAGLGEDLEPILISGLRLFYYRLGFVQMGVLDSGVAPEYVVLFSASAEKKIKETCGPEAWGEITRYSQANAKHWRKIVAAREAKLMSAELAERIAAKRAKQALRNP